MAQRQRQAIGTRDDVEKMWEIVFHDDFVPEYRALSESVQNVLVASMKILREKGPLLGRPSVDTLKGSRHANMKELRFDADGGCGALHLLSIQNAKP
jgi:hypothetical protein